MLFKKNLCFFIFAVIAGLFTACDSAGTDYPYGPVSQGNIEALVLNEGGINQNMGGISVLNKDGSVIPDIFREVNHRPLGDVAQSITKINGKYFVTLDNSKKIEVIDPETFGSVGTILYTQAGFPRQIVAISPTEAIVSDLERQLVRIRTVEPYGEPLEYISIPRSVEYLVTVDNKIFGMTTGGIYVFDTDNISKKAVRVIPEVKNDENTKTCRMLVDKYQRVWALMNIREGNRVCGIELVCIDPHQEKVEVSYTLPISEKANPQAGDVIGTITYNRTDIDPTLNWIYFNVKTCKSNTAAGITSVQSVYRMNVGTGEFEHYLDLPGIDMMYGFSVSPQGEVYLCDCLDYSAQRGDIRNYKKDGSIRNFRVGIYPSQVYFP